METVERETVIERNIEKVISAAEAKELERMTEYRVTDLVREGREAGIQKSVGWLSDDRMCFLATAVTVAKAHGIEL